MLKSKFMCDFVWLTVWKCQTKFIWTD